MNYMNPFEKTWITSTCAPESITRIKENNGNYLNKVVNEEGSIAIVVLSNNNKIQAIGKTYQDLLDSPGYSFKEGISKVAELLELTSYSIINT